MRSGQRARRLICWLAVLLCCVVSSRGQEPKTVEPKPAEPKPVDNLFKADEFPKGWLFYSAESNAKIESSWTVQKKNGNGSDLLVCAGTPFGYLRTVETYEDYEFGLEWNYPTNPNGNSGVLVHTIGADKIWPTAIQIQLHRPKAGSVFPSADAKTENTVDVKDLAKPVNQWNTCVITCRAGKISVVINDKKAGEVTGCAPNKGTIALQSEGAEVHFRNIWLRRLN